MEARHSMNDTQPPRSKREEFSLQRGIQKRDDIGLVFFVSGCGMLVLLAGAHVLLAREFGGWVGFFSAAPYVAFLLTWSYRKLRSLGREP
jgi:hypothetical protein